MTADRFHLHRSAPRDTGLFAGRRFEGVRMVARNYEPDSQVRMQRHEVDLMLDAAARAGGELPLARALAGLLYDAIAAGDGGSDSAVIVEALRRRFPA